MMLKAASTLLVIAFSVGFVIGCSGSENSLHVHNDGSITPGINEGYCLVLMNEETFFDGPIMVACDINEQEIARVEMDDQGDLFEFPVTAELADGRNAITLRFLPEQTDWRFSTEGWDPKVGDVRDLANLVLFNDGELILEHRVKVEVTGTRESDSGEVEAALRVRYPTAYYDMQVGHTPGVQN